MWPLCRDIDVVSGIHSGRVETILVSGRLRGNDGAQLSLSDERRRKKKSEQQQSHRNLPMNRYQNIRGPLRRGFLLCGAKNGAQSLSDNDFFPGLDGHRNQFDVVGPLAFFSIRLTLANRLDQAWIVCPEYFDYGIARAQLLDTIGNTVSPSLLIPRDFQRGISVFLV